MNEASEPIQYESPEQTQIGHATELAEKVSMLAERRAKLAAGIDAGEATEKKREELADLDHVLLWTRADLIKEAGTAGAKPEDE